MISKLITNLPNSVQARVFMALIANTNARLISLARSEFNALRRLGMPESANQTLDGYAAEAEAQRTRHRELDGTNATTQARDNGMSHPTDPSKLAEPWVSLKIALMDKFDSFCRGTGQTMPDQSLAGYIQWQRTTTFAPNQVLAKARFTASGGRISVEAAIRLQRDEFEQDRQNLLNNGEKVLMIAENFAALETEGDEYDIDAIVSTMDEISQLSIVNGVWRKLNSLWEGKNGFASSRFRTADLSGDMNLVTIAEQDCLATASEIFANCEEKYSQRLAAGQNELAIVTAMLQAKREAAKLGAPVVTPTVTGRILRKAADALPGTLGEKLAATAQQ